MTINNTNFENNYAEGKKNTYIYGGALYNVGTMTINDSKLTNNYCIGKEGSIGIGGAVYNNGNLSINNTVMSNNHIETALYGDGGALYNESGGTATIKNSLIENNTVSTNAQFGEGGAIFNKGTLIVENTTLKGNYDRTGDANDIHNTETGTVEFNGEGTTNILSGISGSGKLNKNGSGVLNLGGKNDEYTGDFNFNEGTVNLLADSSYFKAQNTNFQNNVNFNMQNKEINNINFGNLNLSGTSNIYADVNFNNNTMDRINAASISGSGDLFVKNLAIEGTPKGDYISIPFADSVLKDYVSYTPSTIHTPLYDYNSTYDSSDGNFEFSRGVLTPQ